jgi:site-specific DNA-cytosine methylase
VKIESARMTPEEGGYETWREEPVARTLNGMGQAGTNGALAAECERLQSFPDGWTIIEK